MNIHNLHCNESCLHMSSIIKSPYQNVVEFVVVFYVFLFMFSSLEFLFFSFEEIRTKAVVAEISHYLVR